MKSASSVRSNRPGSDIWLVYRRELDARFASKGYFVGMLVMVLVVFGLIVGLNYANSPKTADIAVCGASATSFGTAPQETRLRHCDDPRAAREEVEAKDVDAAVAVHDGVVSVLVRADTPQQSQDAAMAVAHNWATNSAYREQNVDTARLDAAIAKTAPHLVTVGDGAGSSVQVGTAISMVIILFMQIIGQGSLIAQGVVEEKSTRIVEVLLSTLTPLRLMIGKVTGIGTSAILQIVALVAAVAGAQFAMDDSAGSLPGIGALISCAVWFLLAFALFASLFAAAGSLVSRPEDLQSVLTPLMVLVMAPVGVAAAAAGDLSADWVHIVQYIPPVSGLLMPLQACVGGVSVSQQMIAAAFMLLAIAGCMALAARIYRNSILKLGASVSWRHALAT
ncbi:ABC transporter permease [Streptomyces sp. G44]|uniref:ABC transporter permease n=1 Tax=Streptomyces sp. G44 TaxID=2807632 RepID=UPI00195F9F9B|nr:ABC transporter permease [Streptomyces sp. G44]MBM7167695.1 ABC transporter permease [Streptomyces sp. G44]